MNFLSSKKNLSNIYDTIIPKVVLCDGACYNTCSGGCMYGCAEGCYGTCVVGCAVDMCAS
jgi:hypothetical protein